MKNRSNEVFSYESGITDSMLEYAFHRCQHLTEAEVFLGIIIGKRGIASRRQRGLAIAMKDRFEREVRQVNAWICADGDALEKAMACLFVGKDARKDGTQRIGVGLVSFGWIAAATCLQMLDEYQSKDVT